MPDSAFLTDSRREVLSGEYDGAESTLKSKKSHIRTRAQMAMDELIEVAQSAEIENESVFEPETIGTLIYWILNDPAQIDHVGGLVGTGEAPDDVPQDIWTKIPEELQQYRREVHSETAQELLSIDYPTKGRQQPD